MFFVPGGGEEEIAAKGERLAAGELTAQAEKLYPKLVGRFDWRHIIPKYLGGARNGGNGENPARVPSVNHQ